MKGKRLKPGDIVMMKATSYANEKNVIGALAIVVKNNPHLGFWKVKVGPLSLFVYRREIEHFGTTRKGDK